MFKIQHILLKNQNDGCPNQSFQTSIKDKKMDSR